MAETAIRRRVFAGDRVRALRATLGVSQAALAARLRISVSYLSQIESGDRPITNGVLASLAGEYPAYWDDAVEEGEGALLVAAIEAATDPTVPLAALDREAMLRGVRQQPRLASRMVALHAALRRSREQLGVINDRVDSGPEGALLPWEEARDWFQAVGNYVDPLDRAAERLAERIDVRGTPVTALVERLRAAHGVELDAADDEAGRRLRAFDEARGMLRVDRALPLESQIFQIAHQLMRLDAREAIAEVARAAPLRSVSARRLVEVGLANYAAGALLMPYGAFRMEAQRTRHDVDRLRRLFPASFEQICHRLSTLQRPGAPGVPFFFCRVDMAGNITKRHSATRLQFGQFGGACPLWIVHEAAAIPDRILTQVAETPDGVRYVSMAKGLVKASVGYHRAPRRYAIALGCEIEHARLFVYADGLDIAGPDAATPIGTSCRICPRRDCDQRAFPPAGRDITVNPDVRRIVPYEFE